MGRLVSPRPLVSYPSPWSNLLDISLGRDFVVLGALLSPHSESKSDQAGQTKPRFQAIRSEPIQPGDPLCKVHISSNF